jgi:uncharacterized repeat protein (TIGR03803 family)
MQLVERNSVTKGRVNISDVGPRFRSTRRATPTIRGAITLAVLSALLLIAVRPAQAQTESVLYNFTGGADGSGPESKLTFHGGNLYGTTNAGGLGSGTVFELSPNGSGGWTETVLYNFCSVANCADGANPKYSYVTFDSAGNLYGTAYAGGANGNGVVFELSPTGASWTETVLYSFGSSPDGANPVNGLIMDAGNLYGTTYAGGSGGNGTVFQLTPSGGTWTEKVIYEMHSNYAGLVMDGSGNIFGTNWQAAFKLSPNGSGGWNPAVIYTFAIGANPNGTLVLDSAGNAYGTTYAGGGNGNVYKLIRGTGGKWTRTILYGFGSSGPNHPLAGIVFDSAGNIYGTTTQGGIHHAGDVFELVSLGNGSYKFKTIQPFNGENGGQPFGSLILDSAGFVYGTGTGGGVDGFGVVFECNANATVTTTTITSSPNPSSNGQLVTFTATVTPAPPDGETVIFEAIGDAPLSGGKAVFQTSSLPVGYTKVRAIYFGDFNFLNSRSNWIYQHVE